MISAENNISVEIGDGKFNFRVGAIIIQANKILLCKNPKYPNYYTVGGRVSIGESTEQAVLREVREETKQRFTIDRLLFINENFFHAHWGKAHELCFYYLMKSQQPVVELPAPAVENHGTIPFHWVELDRLKKVDLRPEFLKTELKTLPLSPRVIVTR